MTTGFRVQSNGNKDLDDIFDPYQGGTKPSSTGYKVGAQDLRDRFSPRDEGDAAPVTHMAVGSLDLNQLFAAKGTSTKALVIPFGSYYAASRGSHDAQANFTLTMHPDGTWDIDLSALGISSSTSGSPQSGNWHKSPASGVGSDYQVRFVAHITIDDQYSPGDKGSYTATTGWLTLSSDRVAQASTGHLLSGGAGSGTVNVQGYWYVDIRKVGSTVTRRSTCDIDLSALA